MQGFSTGETRAFKVCSYHIQSDKSPNMRRFRSITIIASMLLLMMAASNALAQTNMPRTDDSLKARVYDSAGKEARIEDILEAMTTADVVFIGEQHDDAPTHAIEVELLQRAFMRFARGDEKTRRQVVLALEMFERDVQIVVDEYLAGLISERHFIASSRPWKNYEADYRPLVEFARAHSIPVVASNAPARYVSRVSQNGPASLSELSSNAKSWLPPLPIAAASQIYASKFNDFLRRESARVPAQQQPGATVNPHTAPSSAHGGAALHLLDAQNLRDASMGHAIAEQLSRRSGSLVLHVNGNFHSQARLGAPEHLKRYSEKARVLVITTLPAATFDAANMTKLGDFVVLTGAPADK